MLKIGPTQEQIDVVQDECNARIDDGYSRGEGMTYEEGVLAAILWLRGEADNPLEGGDD